MASRTLWVLGAALLAVYAFAGLDSSYVLPADHEAIQYATAAVNDPVARMNRQLEAGAVKLEYKPDGGYLESVVKQLGIPASSQVLVFSKTSFQAARISPRNPRALYFNDEVSVGFVRGGDVLELASVDPKQGVIFYVLDQEQSEAPRFIRQDSCLQCHASGSTLGVPGLVVRSVYPDRNGMPLFQAGSFLTDHRSPLEQRWGGWYVTGTHGDQRHMGNRIFAATDVDTPKSDGLNRKNLDGLIDAGAWLRPTSDIVALMVLEHQTRMQNLITRAGWETRLAVHQRESMNKALGEPPGTMTESTRNRIRNVAAEVVRHLLMTDEAPLTAPVVGTSGFAEEYASSGPRDSKGRSLRELELQRRLFKYRCSPLVYSRAFQQMPPLLREEVNRLLTEKFSADDPVREILTATGVLASSQ